MAKVYLAGGMHSNWRQQVIEMYPDVTFFDPKSHGLTDEKTYTAWDLDRTRAADLVFAYMDADNPSGYGLMMEIGFAHALGKRIIFVDETDDAREASFGMARAVAYEVYNDLGEATEGLGGYI